MSKSKEEEILEYVIKLIDKRIPKKPNVSAYNEDGSLLIYKCPSCASPYDVDYDGQYDYCPKCGQAIALVESADITNLSIEEISGGKSNEF